MDIKDKVVFITGGTTGIGLATARTCIDRGARVVVYSVSEPTDEELFKNDNILFIKGDITNAKAVEKAFKKAIKTFGSCDVLINNAAIVGRKPFIDTTPKDWDKLINVNIKGTLTVTKAFLENVKEGVIINIASGAGEYGIREMGVYSLTKAAIINFTQSLSQEVGEKIRIATVAPGSTDTAMFSKAFPTREPKHVPQEVADVILKTIVGDITPDDRLIVDVFEHSR